MSDSLCPHGLQHARLPCPSLSPNLLRLMNIMVLMIPLTISFSVAPFSSCPQSFPPSRSLPMSRLFAIGSQSIGASASVFPMNIQGWFPLGLIDLILLSNGFSSLLQYHNLKASILWRSDFFMVQVSHPYMTTGKTIALTIKTFFWQSDVSAF